ncbi:OLC1v1009099C1 [Oldenlandia corymbosa var. corymbosa]|uniref:OLC1v1009099C1 n=1 Tax=Oldenlandia corymbosa var. corymbosa TaxID=529605 RepID=A0AAV1DQL7_OLDCO|nr:OLC1v1009099C1 [Oldenlandia corymbosa var. corymbosa]
MVDQSKNCPLGDADLEVRIQEQNPRGGKDVVSPENSSGRWVSWAEATEKQQEVNPWQKFDGGKMRGNGSNLVFIPPQEIEGRKICKVKQQPVRVGERSLRSSDKPNGKIISNEGEKMKQKGVVIQQRQQGYKEEKIYRPAVIGRMNENIAMKQQFWNSMFDRGSTSENKEVKEVESERR